MAGDIGPGLLVLVGVSREDGPKDAERLAAKVSKLRIFSDDEGKMNLNLNAVAGSLLVVSQFTLYAEVSRGNRPSYTAAAPPERAKALYEAFMGNLRGLGHPVASGVFGADMAVTLHNDGPVTILLDSAELGPIGETQEPTT